MTIPAPKPTANVRIEAERHPFIFAQLSNKLGKKDFRVLGDFFEQVLNAGQRTVLLCDLHPVTGLKALELTTFWVPWTARNRKTIERLSVGTAFVTNSKVVAKIVNLLIKALPLKSELHVFQDIPGALAWLQEISAEHGLDLPDLSDFSA